MFQSPWEYYHSRLKLGFQREYDLFSIVSLNPNWIVQWNCFSERYSGDYIMLTIAYHADYECFFIFAFNALKSK